MFRLPWPARRAPAEAPLVSLALQGGGAHGAYTWGVLDRLLEAGIRIEGISGTSAGAMNAVALAHGWTAGGADGARAALDDFWQAVGDSVPFHVEMLNSINSTADSALPTPMRSEEHTSELQSRENLVCRLLLEKKKKNATE